MEIHQSTRQSSCSHCASIITEKGQSISKRGCIFVTLEIRINKRKKTEPGDRLDSSCGGDILVAIYIEFSEKVSQKR